MQAETHGTSPGGNAPSRRTQRRHITVGWLVTLQVRGLLAERASSRPAAAERAPGGGPASAPQTDASLLGGGSHPPAGRTGRPASRPAGPASPPISRSQVPRSQIPARGIGNGDYPFTDMPVTWTWSAVTA